MSDTSLIASTGDIAPENARDGLTGNSYADDFKGISQAIESGNWIDGAIAGLGAALNVAGTVLDPFGSLASMGVSWAIEQCEPLREALDWFAGDPEAVEVDAITWDNITAEVASIGDDLLAMLEGGGLDEWEGAAGDAYRAMLGVNVDCAYALSGTAAAMAAATRGAGTVVTTVRDFVRDFVSECVGHVVAWLAVEAAPAHASRPDRPCRAHGPYRLARGPRHHRRQPRIEYQHERERRPPLEHHNRDDRAGTAAVHQPDRHREYGEAEPEQHQPAYRHELARHDNAAPAPLPTANEHV